VVLMLFLDMTYIPNISSSTILQNNDLSLCAILKHNYVKFVQSEI